MKMKTKWKIKDENEKWRLVTKITQKQNRNRNMNQMGEVDRKMNGDEKISHQVHHSFCRLHVVGFPVLFSVFLPRGS